MSSASEQITAIPDDDPTRALTRARPDTDKSLVHLAIAGDTYTILVAGTDTAGRYTLIDMHVPPGGGPPPHRHDFEELFTLLDGEIEFTFRGETMVARSGETINIPANARTRSATPATDLPVCCACARPLGRRSFSSRSAPESPTARRRRQSWARQSKWSGGSVPQPWRRSTGLSYSRLRRDRRVTSDEPRTDKKALRDLDYRKAREGPTLCDARRRRNVAVDNCEPSPAGLRVRGARLFCEAGKATPL
jgi:quercetin dioxygenase-like cupin family protein